MTALAAAIQRRQGRAQALQAQALRVAAWGDAQDFGRMLDGLRGVTPPEIADAEAMYAAWAGGGVSAGR